MRSTLLAFTSAIVFALTGCASADADEEEAQGTENALAAADFKSYSVAFGLIAVGEEAKTLHQAITKGGGKDLGKGTVLAGFTAKELGVNDGKDDENEPSGVFCQSGGKDGPDTCSLMAVVESKEQEKPGLETTLTGKLAKQVAITLPRTSPAGLVGVLKTGAAGISCTTGAGPARSACVVKGTTILTSVEDMVKAPGGKLSADDAKKLIKAFFPAA